MQGQSGSMDRKEKVTVCKRSVKDEAEREEPLLNEIQFKGISRKPEQMKADTAAEREGHGEHSREMEARQIAVIQQDSAYGQHQNQRKSTSRSTTRRCNCSDSRGRIDRRSVLYDATRFYALRIGADPDSINLKSERSLMTHSASRHRVKCRASKNRLHHGHALRRRAGESGG